METLARIFVASAAVVWLTGCYSSPVPLGSPSDGWVDTTWVGEWRAVSDSTGEIGRVRLFAFNQTELLAEVSGDTVVGGIAFDWKRARFRVFPTEVEGTLFANVQPIDVGEDRNYFFYRVDVQADTMVLRAVGSELFREGGWLGGTELKFSDSAALWAYVAERLDDPQLHEDDRSVFVKVKEVEE